VSAFLDRVRRRLPDYPPYYDAPVGDLLRLDQNTNRWGPHPAALTRRPAMDAVNLYPQRDNQPLVDALAAAFGVDPAMVFAANGSDEVLDLLLRLLVEPGGRVATPHPSYSMYPHLCRLNRLTHVQVPYDGRFHVTAQALIEADADLVLMANPDNPSGTVLDPAEIGRLVDGFDGPVVVDEAYADYAGSTLLPLVGTKPNLVVTRTLSKAYGLAGLRVGFGAAHPEVAELIRRARVPFAVNHVSQDVAIAAVADPGPAVEGVRRVAAEREKLAASLERLGFSVVPSATNFLLTLPPVRASELEAALRSRGILARTFEHEPALADHVRFTVGTPPENQRLLEALTTIIDAPEAE
jgi:histidinol-phosphate aminotransferase